MSRKEIKAPYPKRKTGASLLGRVDFVKRLSLFFALAIFALCIWAVLRSWGSTQQYAGGAAIFLALCLPFCAFYVTFYFGCRRRAPELESFVVESNTEITHGKLTHTTTYKPTGDSLLDTRMRTCVFARAHAGANAVCFAFFFLVLIGIFIVS